MELKKFIESNITSTKFPDEQVFFEKYVISDDL